MKKVILVTAFCGILGLAIPGTPLHADVGFGGRIDLGVDLLGVPAFFPSGDDDGGVIPIIPLLDAGFYGQFTAGPFRAALGLRGMSVFVYINLFWPAFQAEIDIGSRFTLTGRVGGGFFWLFPVWGVGLPMIIPEASMWFRLNKAPQNRMHIGVGAIWLLSAGNVNIPGADWIPLEDFNGNVMIYFGFKVAFNSDLIKD